MMTDEELLGGQNQSSLLGLRLSWMAPAQIWYFTPQENQERPRLCLLIQSATRGMSAGGRLTASQAAMVQPEDVTMNHELTKTIGGTLEWRGKKC
ncbi:MAG: hypothetical protein ACYS4W_04210 [Planctomycetota bacterium]|jgi:hypothetical protein